MYRTSGLRNGGSLRAASKYAVELEAPRNLFADLPEDIGLQLATTLGPDANAKADRIAADVRQAARTIFGRPQEPRPSSRPKELKSLLKGARKGPLDPTCIALHLWPYLLVEDEDAIENLCEPGADLSAAIQLAIEIAESDPETHLSRKGGRHRDSRIDAFAMALAQIYRRYTNQRPTVTFEPDKGHMVSPFALFAFEAFSLVYRNTRMPEGSIQTAIRQVVEFERETEPISDDVLVTLLAHTQ